MQINGLQQTSAAQSVSRPQASKAAGPVQSAPAVNSPGADELDLSAEAQQISSAQSTNATQGSEGIRTEKVASIRQAIADGSYETPEKMSAALDKLLDTFA